MELPSSLNIKPCYMNNVYLQHLPAPNTPVCSEILKLSWQQNGVTRFEERKKHISGLVKMMQVTKGPALMGK